MRLTLPGTPFVDMTDRAGRVLGVADISDNIARLLGVTRAEIQQKIAAGQAYRYANSLNPGVGNIVDLSLFNPVASGVTLIPYRFQVSGGTADAIQTFATSADLGTTIVTAKNLKVGGAAAKATVRFAAAGAGGGATFGTVAINAGGPTLIYDRPWIAVPAGFRVEHASETTNLGFRFNIDWLEI